MRSYIKTALGNQYFTPKYTHQSINAPPLATFPTSIIFLPVAKPSAKPHGLDGEGSLRRWFEGAAGLGGNWQVGMALAGRMVLALGLEQVGGARSFWYAAPSSSSSVLPELVWERGERREGRPPGRVAVVSSAAALTPRASAKSSSTSPRSSTPPTAVCPSQNLPTLGLPFTT